MTNSQAIGDFGVARDEKHVWYIYGVAENPVVDRQLEGIGGAPVMMLHELGVAVLASPLPRDRFGPEEWQEHADDIRWLSDVARDHHDVLRQIARNADVVPMRVPTIFASRQRACDTLVAQSPALVKALDRVRGRLEWGVKVFVEGDSKNDNPDPRQYNRGTEYLAARLTSATERAKGTRRRMAALTAAHGLLAEHAVDAVSNRPQDPSLHGHDASMVLNAAYLVPRSTTLRFSVVAGQLADCLSRDHNMSLEQTGPWPPYNFAEVHL